MPGRHLSKIEKKLIDFWESPPKNFSSPLLRSIEVSGGGGLRGLDAVIIPFRYPVTAVCGKNGSGKSTVLALAALAHHSPSNWYVSWSNTRCRHSRLKNHSYYVFGDFFHYGPKEKAPTGVNVTWRYLSKGSETSQIFTKTPKRWGTYKHRPARAVDYAPLSRLLPAHELNTVRGAFSAHNPNATRNTLSEQYRGYLSYIMNAVYQDAEILQTDRLTFPECETDVQYSGFNMGGGESCVAQLMYLLQRLPLGGLLVVEEIESCLHPEAQVRLAEVLLEICNEKRLQVICSTHSEVFLDALPRQARLLLQKRKNNVSVLEEPSTRFAIYEMRGEVQPELNIYCEDSSAAVLIEEAISYKDRTRVRVLDVGSDATVIRQGVSHLRGGFRGGCLCVPDGDTNEAELAGWIKSEANENEEIKPVVELLPGDNLPPERWVIKQLAHEDYRNELAKQLGCDRGEANAHIGDMRVQLNHHKIAYTLSKRTGKDEGYCLRQIMKSVAPFHPELESLRQRISSLLS